jgi:hypothetical protein
LSDFVRAPSPNFGSLKLIRRRALELCSRASALVEDSRLAVEQSKEIRRHAEDVLDKITAERAQERRSRVSAQGGMAHRDTAR